MHANAFDRYEPIHSPVHTLDARVKVVAAILFILSNVLLPDGAWLAFLISWGLLLLANLLSRLGPAYTFKRSFIAIPFALAAITALFSIPGPAWVVLNLGPWRLTMTQPGLLRFISILVRSWLSVQAAVLMVATTQFPDLLHALRHLRVPAPLVAIISFMYRYMFVLSDEALRMMRARQSRSARPAGTTGEPPIAWRARITGHMAGQLFLRSYERSDRIYNAMLSRGYQGQLLTMNPHILKPRDWAVGAAVLALLLLIQVIGRL